MSLIGVIKESRTVSELLDSGLEVLNAASDKYGLNIEYKELYLGEASVAESGLELTRETIEEAKTLRCLLMDDLKAFCGSSASTLAQELGLLLNVKWAYGHSCVYKAMPFAAAPIERDIDVMLASNVSLNSYLMDQSTYLENGIVHASDKLVCCEMQAEKIAQLVFRLANDGGKSLVYADRADVLEVSRLWRMLMSGIKYEYPDVRYSEMLLGELLYELTERVNEHDVIMVDGLFSDPMAFNLSMSTGIMQLSDSYLGEGEFGIFGSFGIDQKNVNPTAMILSVAMLLKHSFGHTEAHDRILSALDKVLRRGCRTEGIAEDRSTAISALQLGKYVAEEVRG